MGALHSGHLSLVQIAREECERVAMSIFVNPTQFAPHEDFNKYPRPLERDLELAEAAGCDAVFVPTVDEIYSGYEIGVQVKGLSEQYEGAARPGHFDGVATVVAKLFLITQCDVAVFGWKDLQQCAVIATLVRQMHFAVRLKFGEVIREPDGLAMSSRNVYLDEHSRKLAPQLHSELLRARSQLLESNADVMRSLEESAQRLNEMGFQVNYMVPVDPTTLEWSVQPGVARLMAAAKLGPIRLLDNIPL